MIVGIDVGRNSTKVVTENKAIHFKSVVGDAKERTLNMAQTDYEMEIDGKRYFIADLAEDSDFPREMASISKVHEDTLLLFLAGISLVAEQEPLQIITGLPVNQHNQITKSEFIQLLKGQHIVDKKTINIDTIQVAPEGGGAYWNNVLQNDGSIINNNLSVNTVRVVDIGSRTINYCTIRSDRKYVERESGTLDYGIISLENVDKALREQTCSQFTKKVIADLSKRIPNSDIYYFTGGGSIILQKWLSDYYKRSQFAENGIMDNAQGFYKMGVLKWQRENK